MIYLLLGEDTQAKDTKISQIKSHWLTLPEAIHFDFESLDAQQVSSANLKKSLLSLPMTSTKRVILIRHVQNLKNEAALVLLSFASQPQDYCEMILEASEELKGQIKEISPYAQVLNFGFKKELNIFDMTKLMSLKKTSEALKMLHGFYSRGDHPLRMIGALVWYWGKEGRSLGADKFEKGLKALEEADLNIKRSRLLPEYALEKLVVELVELFRN